MEPEQFKQALKFQEEKVANLHKAAAIAKDLEKICLGAFVALTIPSEHKHLSKQKNA